MGSDAELTPAYRCGETNMEYAGIIFDGFWYHVFNLKKDLSSGPLEVD